MQRAKNGEQDRSDSTACAKNNTLLILLSVADCDHPRECDSDELRAVPLADGGLGLSIRRRMDESKAVSAKPR